jgi:phosphatidate cytidylyltransferase
MFKQRLLTTLVLVPLALLAIFYGPTWLLCSVVLILVAIGGFEWTNLIPLKHRLLKIAFILTLLALVWPATLWLKYWAMTAIIVWLFILVAVISYPRTQSLWAKPIIIGGLSLFLLPLFAACLEGIYLFPQGKQLILYMFGLVWAADIGAYLAGKAWGETKLIPNVSPGKTIEGVMGGFVLALCVSVIAYWYFAPVKVVPWFMLAGITALITVLGDLFISVLKRRANVKDSGNLFPGHGGMLDRFDSLLAALPFFYVGLIYMPAGL